MSDIETVGILGSGAWGTALAQVAARAGRKVALWSHDPTVAATIAATRANPVYLPGVRLEDAVEPTDDLAVIGRADLVLAVAPAQYLRGVLSAFAVHARPDMSVVLCSKGVEQGTLKLMSEVLAETLPDATPAVLSGPNFAAEVARGLPAAATLACIDDTCAERIARALATPTFRPYLSTDLVGAEASGAVKNVLAIACGIVEGKALGRNAHAALITRGFAEMTRFAVALGAKAETLSGLCGLGDLVLTCSSSQSRNMSVGLALGRGQTLDEALAGKVSVAEGVASAPAVRALGQKLGVEMPVSEAVAAVLAGEINVDQAIMGLLSRPLKAEAE